MENQIEIFRSEKFGAIRTVEISDEIWFVGKDVATALGYQNTKKAIADHVDDDDKQKGDGVTIRDSIDRIQHPVIINESGLYSLILSSKLESAKEFKRWIINKVIMAIHNEDKSLVKTFSFQLSDVDCFEQNGALYFKMADVAKCLDYSSPDNWNGWLDEDEILFRKINGIKKPMKYISESALYRILAKVNVPKAKPFERWVTRDVIPSIRKTGSYSVSQKSKQELDNETEKNRLAKANIYLELSKKYSGNKEYSQILDAYATKSVEGKFVLPLPKLEEKNYSATEVGEMLGISKNAVGKIAKRLGIKTDGEFGKWYVDKSPFSNKEVNTFRYSGKAVDLIRKEV